MPTATSETESKSHDISICVHHYTLRAPCPKGQENALLVRQSTEYFSVQFRGTFVTCSGHGVLLLRRASTNKVLDAMRRGDHTSVVCPQTSCSMP